MLHRLVLGPPTVQSRDVRRRWGKWEYRKRSRGKIRTIGVNRRERFQDVANKVIGMDKRVDSFVPGKEIMLRRKKRDVGNTR
jgi:hypothetical protein